MIFRGICLLLFGDVGFFFFFFVGRFIASSENWEGGGGGGDTPCNFRSAKRQHILTRTRGTCARVGRLGEGGHSRYPLKMLKYFELAHGYSDTARRYVYGNQVFVVSGELLGLGRGGRVLECVCV